MGDVSRAAAIAPPTWLHLDFGRTEAELALKSPGVPIGMFVVRGSSAPNSHVLSLLTAPGVVVHYAIAQQRGQFTMVEGHNFVSLAALVTHAMSTGLLVDGAKLSLLPPRDRALSSATHACERCLAPISPLVLTCGPGTCLIPAPVAKATPQQLVVCRHCGGSFSSIAVLSAHVHNCFLAQTPKPTTVQLEPAAPAPAPVAAAAAAVPIMAPTPALPWPCPACTFLNPASEPRCSMCRRRRTALSPTDRADVTDAEIWAKQGILQQRVVKSQSWLRDWVGVEHKARLAMDFAESQFRASASSFWDEEFPPNNRSLFIDPAAPVKMFRSSVTCWKRAAEAVARSSEAPATVVCQNPRASDIVQGEIGNCWLISAMSVLADRGDMVESLFLSRDVSACGAYQIRLCNAGRWQVITVDDYLPCRKDGRIAMSESREGQLWVPLLEKAVAKVHGSYEAMHAGSLCDGLALLTGAPCETLFVQHAQMDGSSGATSTYTQEQQDFIWGQLLSFSEAGYLMGVSVPAYGDDIYSATGLASNHAYAVLDVCCEEGHRLLRLRNPWGRSSWRGDWSNSSPLWTTSLREKLQPSTTSIENGCSTGDFWMCLRDVLQYSKSIDVCKVQTSWHRVAIKGRFLPSIMGTSTAFHISITAPTVLEISLFQIPQHESGEESVLLKNDALVDIGVAVLQNGAGEHILCSTLICDTTRRITHRQCCSVFLENAADTYFILPISLAKINAGSPKGIKYLCVLHTSKPVTVVAVQVPALLTGHALAQQTIKYGRRQDPFPPRLLRLYEYDSQFAVENLSTTLSLNVAFKTLEHHNFVSSREVFEVEDIIPPLRNFFMIAFTPVCRDAQSVLRFNVQFKAVQLAAQESKARHMPPLFGSADLHCAIGPAFIFGEEGQQTYWRQYSVGAGASTTAEQAPAVPAPNSLTYAPSSSSSDESNSSNSSNSVNFCTDQPESAPLLLEQPVVSIGGTAAGAQGADSFF